MDPSQRIEELSRQLFTLRERRAQLLEQYAVADEQALLDLILTGRLPEHPAYDDYLSVRILSGLRDAAKEELDRLRDTL